MHPFGNQLGNAAAFDTELKSVLSEGHIIGFLIDSKVGDLKRSGLLTEPESVMPLHNLLGSDATIFYPDPRGFNPDEYKQAIDEFSNQLIKTTNIRFEIKQLSLLLMTYRLGAFEDVVTLKLDKDTICMWHQEVYTFIERYMTNNSAPSEKVTWLRDKIQSHAGVIGVEAIKSCVGLLMSKIV